MADLSTTKIYGDLTVSNNIKGYRIANLDDISVIYEDRSITAGNGLSGGGALSNNLTISMGTPTGLTASTDNALTATSHTHSIATDTAVGLSNASVSGTGTSTSLARADHTHAITGFSLDTHNHTLDSLSNVTITSIASGEIVKWNGTSWINNTLAEAGIQPLDADLSAIADLAGVTGLLRKTAANTWTLDTTGYTTNTGTVTSVAMTVPTGLTITGSPISTSGTLALSFTSGYSIPTTAKQIEWNTAYTNTHVSGSDNQTITSGNGMSFTSGSGNVTIALGTPTGLTASTTNALTANSHTHSIATATAVGLSNASVSGVGTSTSLARADHTHAITGFLTGNQTITLSGDATGTGTTAIAVTVVNDSHTHDTRYYTETESDERFVNAAGDSMTGNLVIDGDLIATSKSFRIPHPTKEGKTLTYGSLEGPENGVYVRGRTTERMIRLPEYWRELIDENTITVQITPIKKNQKLVVGEVGVSYVEIINKNFFSKKIDCYYIIHAERKDIPKLKVEE